jgi:hypothetical protein
MMAAFALVPPKSIPSHTPSMMPTSKVAYLRLFLSTAFAQLAPPPEQRAARWRHATKRHRDHAGNAEK